MVTENQLNFSQREVAVLRMMANGKQKKHMAKEFGISPNTAKDVVRRVYLKLRASNGAQAVALAMRAGII